MRSQVKEAKTEGDAVSVQLQLTSPSPEAARQISLGKARRVLVARYLDNVVAAQAMFPVLSHTEMAGDLGENDVVDASDDEIEQAAVGYCYGDSTCGQRAFYELGHPGIPIYNVNNNCSTGSTAPGWGSGPRAPYWTPIRWHWMWIGFAGCWPSGRCWSCRGSWEKIAPEIRPCWAEAARTSRRSS